jgi:hypothetical protein
MADHDPLTQLESTWSGKDRLLITSDWAKSLTLRPSHSRMRGSTVDMAFSFTSAASFPRRVARVRVEREEALVEAEDGPLLLRQRPDGNGGEHADSHEVERVVPVNDADDRLGRDEDPRVLTVRCDALRVKPRAGLGKGGRHGHKGPAHVPDETTRIPLRR